VPVNASRQLTLSAAGAGAHVLLDLHGYHL